MRTLTKLLLITYSLLITGYGIMELSHEIMHTIKNKFHHHVEAQHHHLGDHHTGVYSAVPEDDDHDYFASLYSYLLFYESSTAIVTYSLSAPTFLAQNLIQLESLYPAPIVPPPLSAKPGKAISQ